MNNAIDISNLNVLGPKKFFAETFKILFRNLSDNPVMQKLLLYEMSVVNDTTKRTAETRDIMNLNLITYYETLFKPAKVNIKSIAAILIGGIYYLILHKECAKICTIDSVSYTHLDVYKRQAPSHAAEAMEMGASACLVNTAIAVAGDPVAMAVAFKQAVEAGRMAYEAGLGMQADSFVAEASSPLTAFLNE